MPYSFVFALFTTSICLLGLAEYATHMIDTQSLFYVFIRNDTQRFIFLKRICCHLVILSQASETSLGLVSLSNSVLHILPLSATRGPFSMALVPLSFFFPYKRKHLTHKQLLARVLKTMSCLPHVCRALIYQISNTRFLHLALLLVPMTLFSENGRACLYPPAHHRKRYLRASSGATAHSSP